MKKRFKFLTCVLALSLSVVPLFGCDTDDGEKPDDNTVKIELTIPTITLIVGESKNAGINVIGGIAEISVKDPSIASYADGKITGLKPGTTEVVITLGDKTETLTVTVKEAEVKVATYKVTVNGDVKQYKEGEKISKPSNPTKEKTDEFEYWFDGWYFGDKKWDFENDTVTENITLEAKFNQNKRKYSVNIDGRFVYVEYGGKIPTPETPTKPSTQTTEYVFEKWVLWGTETEWNFETDVVKGDVALTPVFTEKVREYTYVYDFETETIEVGKGSYTLFELSEEDYAAMCVELFKGENSLGKLDVADGKITVKQPQGTYLLKITYKNQEINKTCRLVADGKATIKINQNVELGGANGEFQSFGQNYTVEGNSVTLTNQTYAYIGGEKPTDTVYYEAVTDFSSGVGQMAGFMPACEQKDLSQGGNKLLFSYSGNNKLYYQETKEWNGAGVTPLITLHSSVYNIRNCKIGVARVGNDYYIFMNDEMIAHYETDSFEKSGFGFANTSGAVNLTLSNVRYCVIEDEVKKMVEDNMPSAFLGGSITYPDGTTYNSFGSSWWLTSPNSGVLNHTTYLYAADTMSNVYYQEATFTREKGWVGLIVNTLDGQPFDNCGWYGYGVYSGGDSIFLHEFDRSWSSGTWKTSLSGVSGDTFKLGVARTNDYYYVFINDKLVISEKVTAYSTKDNSVALPADNMSAAGIFRGTNFSEEGKQITFSDYYYTTDAAVIGKYIGGATIEYGDNVVIEQFGKKIANGETLLTGAYATVKFDIPESKVIKNYSLTKDGKSVGVELSDGQLVFTPENDAKYKVEVEFADAGTSNVTINVKLPQVKVGDKEYNLYDMNIDPAKVTVKLLNVTKAQEQVYALESLSKVISGIDSGYYKLTVVYASNEYSVYFTAENNKDVVVDGYVSETYLGGSITLNGTTFKSFDEAGENATAGNGWRLVDDKRDTVTLTSYTYAFQKDFTGTKYYVEGTFNTNQKFKLGSSFGGMLISHGPKNLSATSDKKFEVAILGKSVVGCYIPDNWSPLNTFIIANFDDLWIEYDLTAVRLGVVRDGTKYWFFVNGVYVGDYVLPEIENECGVGVVASASVNITVSSFKCSKNDELIEALKASAPVKENTQIDVYFVAGQSNASGCTNVDLDTVAALDDHYIYGYNNVYYAGNGGANWMHNMKFGLSRAGLGETATKMGPELGMAEALSTYYNPESGKQAVILKYAVGGTNLTDYVGGLNASDGNWVSPSYAKTLNQQSKDNLTGGLYKNFMAEMFGGLDRNGNDHGTGLWGDLIARGYTPVIKGLYWMQGEADKGNPTEYLKAFKYFAADIRADITTKSGQDCSKMPIFIGEISRTSGSANPGTQTTNKNFIKMQNTIPDNIDNCYVIKNGDIDICEYKDGKSVIVGSDEWHWNYKDCIKIGNMVGQSILSNVLKK